MCIVVLDELDQACKKADSFVKELFMLPKIKNSRLIVVGIANRMDLAERVLKDVGSKADVAPQMISFHSYSARQLLELLKVSAQRCSACATTASARSWSIDELHVRYLQ